MKLSLVLRLTEADGGTRLEFTAESAADGRAAAFAPDAAATAAHRLLDRAAGHLAALAVDGTAGAGEAAVDTAADSDVHADVDSDSDAGSGSGSDSGADSDHEDPGPGFTEVTASVFDTDVPPPSLDPFLEGTFEGMADLGDLGGPRVRRPRPRTPAAR